MGCIACYDVWGNQLSYFTQWDVNQKMIIKGLEFEDAPIFHFCNQDSKESIGVQSKIYEDKDLIVDVPNKLLQEPLKLNVYIYFKKDNVGKTIHIISIPVRHKPKPLDYEYTDNIDVVYIKDIIEEIKAIEEQLQEETQKAHEVAELITVKLQNGELNGATFTPLVSENGDLSWDNDKGLPNPETVNIKGAPGKSIYEIAKDHGFKGSEEEFLNNLKDYNNLINTPKIDGFDIKGEVTKESLGIATVTDLNNTNNKLFGNDKNFLGFDYIKSNAEAYKVFVTEREKMAVNDYKIAFAPQKVNIADEKSHEITSTVQKSDNESEFVTMNISGKANGTGRFLADTEGNIVLTLSALNSNFNYTSDNEHRIVIGTPICSGENINLVSTDYDASQETGEKGNILYSDKSSSDKNYSMAFHVSNDGQAQIIVEVKFQHNEYKVPNIQWVDKDVQNIIFNISFTTMTSQNDIEGIYYIPYSNSSYIRIVGKKGDKGDKGDSFTFDDFTPEQLALLKGEPGTTTYSELEDKPQIDGVTLTGNVSKEELDIAALSALNEIDKRIFNKNKRFLGFNLIKTNEEAYNTFDLLPKQLSENEFAIAIIPNDVKISDEKQTEVSVVAKKPDNESEYVTAFVSGLANGDGKFIGDKNGEGQLKLSIPNDSFNYAGDNKHRIIINSITFTAISNGNIEIVDFDSSQGEGEKGNILLSDKTSNDKNYILKYKFTASGRCRLSISLHFQAYEYKFPQYQWVDKEPQSIEFNLNFDQLTLNKSLERGIYYIQPEKTGGYIQIVGLKGDKGDTGQQGERGANGENGATFAPSVSADGVLSWDNDKGLPNPESINIKGEPGTTDYTKLINLPGTLLELGKNKENATEGNSLENGRYDVVNDGYFHYTKKNIDETIYFRKGGMIFKWKNSYYDCYLFFTGEDIIVDDGLDGDINVSNLSSIWDILKFISQLGVFDEYELSTKYGGEILTVAVDKSEDGSEMLTPPHLSWKKISEIKEFNEILNIEIATNDEVNSMLNEVFN